jgi:hypothetical protein
MNHLGSIGGPHGGLTSCLRTTGFPIPWGRSRPRVTAISRHVPTSLIGRHISRCTASNASVVCPPHSTKRLPARFLRAGGYAHLKSPPQGTPRTNEVLG